jgi:hypothetical protein
VEELSHVDWLTLVLGIILGVPVAYVIGILAHMHTPKFVEFIDRRKLLKTHKTKKQALQVFKRIRAFREGTRDRYPFYMILANAAVSLTVVASTLSLVAFIGRNFSMEFRIILWLLASIAALVMLLLLVGIYETARQIERFDDYRAEFEKRRGPPDSEQP